jgi:hypothetical protein
VSLADATRVVFFLNTGILSAARPEPMPMLRFSPHKQIYLRFYFEVKE